MILLGGSFVVGWTNEVVTGLRHARPDLNIVGIPDDFQYSVAASPETLKLAPFALLRRRANATLAGNACVCATPYDAMPPADPRVRALLDDLACVYGVADRPPLDVVSIRCDVHDAFGRRLALGIPGTVDDVLRAQDTMPCTWGTSVPRLVIPAPPYAADTPLVLEAILDIALKQPG